MRYLIAFAVLVAVYVTIANSSQVSEAGTLAASVKELPCPRNSETTWFVRNKTERDETCVELWGEEAPRRWYVGRAVRYQGDTGPYYVFEGWVPLPDENCTDTDIDESGTFTSNTLLYVPKLARLFEFVQPKESCETSSRKTLTAAEVGKLNREAMAEVPSPSPRPSRFPSPKTSDR